MISVAYVLVVAGCSDDGEMGSGPIDEPTTTAAAGGPLTCANQRYTVTLPDGWYTNRDENPAGSCIAFADGVRPELLVDGMFRRPEGELDLTGYPIAIKYEPTGTVEDLIAGAIESARRVRPTVGRVADGSYTVSDTSEGVRVETVPAAGKRPLAVTVEVTTMNSPLGVPDGQVQLYRIIGHPTGGVFVMWSDLGIARDPGATRRAFTTISSSIELR